jgi:hypothetical protein
VNSFQNLQAEAVSLYAKVKTSPDPVQRTGLAQLLGSLGRGAVQIKSAVQG